MRPIGKPTMSKKEAQAMLDGVKKIGKSIKNYGNNVKGGAKIVSNAVKNKVLKAFKK